MYEIHSIPVSRDVWPWYDVSAYIGQHAPLCGGSGSLRHLAHQKGPGKLFCNARTCYWWRCLFVMVQIFHPEGKVARVCGAHICPAQNKCTWSVTSTRMPPGLKNILFLHAAPNVSTLLLPLLALGHAHEKYSHLRCYPEEVDDPAFEPLGTLQFVMQYGPAA